MTGKMDPVGLVVVVVEVVEVVVVKLLLRAEPIHI
jgi:hypothetical protein